MLDGKLSLEYIERQLFKELQPELNATREKNHIDKYYHFRTFSNIFAKNGSNVLKFGQKTYFMMVFKLKIKNFEKKIFRGFGWTKMAQNSRFWPLFSYFTCISSVFLFKKACYVSANTFVVSL